VQGGLIIFDDSFEHEVYHETELERVVLIIDLVYRGTERQTHPAPRHPLPLTRAG